MHPKNMSIKFKLVGIILVVVSLVMGIGFTAVRTIHIDSLREELVNNVLINAKIVSEHCVVPLTFDDNQAVTKALQPLDLIPAVENGCVYDTSGLLLGSYNRNEEISAPPNLKDGFKWYFENDFLNVIQPIIHNDNKLGIMHLRASTKSLSQKTDIFSMMLFGISLILILVSYFIALWLQGIISKPILELTAVTKDVSSKGDYSVRVSIQRTDEIGELYSGFNNMLEQIAIRKTERDAAVSKTQASEEKLRAYITNAPDGIFVTDAEGRYVEVNQAACKLTGYSESELTSMTISELVDIEQNKNALKDFETFNKTGKLHAEYKVKRKDGTSLWVSLDAVALSEDRFMAFCSDISETKRLQELESRAERLETAGTIAGQVAHDFNNLLGPLMAYPDLIREKIAEDHPILKYLNQMENAAQKIAEINQDLLAMGRRGHYNMEVLNLNDVVKHALSELEPSLETLTCKSNLSDDLLNIFGGGAQLHRVISNLLHNAKDAMGEIGQITVTTENYYVDDVSVIYGRVPKGEYIKLTISDTGCGIPDDIVQKIFDPFFSSKITDKKRGTGLGMSVVDAVIKDHNGYIDLSTKVDEGTSFYVYFPVTRESLGGTCIDETNGGKESILIVDDDEIQREVSSELLTKLGYNSSTVESGEQAVEFLQKNPQDLVILDMIMPGGIDGTETYRRILEDNPHQKAIILSGFSGSDRVLEVQKLGAGAFVKKPITMQTIATAVRLEIDKATKVNV